jgi:AcrR family transcriptional regulator
VTRPQRADARRNRDALLTAARAALAGGEPDIRVEEIARRAGVAVGTLYRHFDTREAVVEEVFRQDLDDLCSSARDGDLRAFLIRLVKHSTRSKGMAAALEAVMATSSPVFDEARRRMEETLDELLAHGVATGTIRADVTGHTVLCALGGVCSPRAVEEESLHIAELFFDGLRYGATTPDGTPGRAARLPPVMPAPRSRAAPVRRCGPARP